MTRNKNRFVRWMFVPALGAAMLLSGRFAMATDEGITVTGSGSPAVSSAVTTTFTVTVN